MNKQDKKVEESVEQIYTGMIRQHLILSMCNFYKICIDLDKNFKIELESVINEITEID